nr:MAG TPA: hypothetical protein [Crassvirales sp.]
MILSPHFLSIPIYNIYTLRNRSIPYSLRLSYQGLFTTSL